MGAAPSCGGAFDFGTPSTAATAGNASSQGAFSLIQPFDPATSGAAACIGGKGLGGSQQVCFGRLCYFLKLPAYFWRGRVE